MAALDGGEVLLKLSEHKESPVPRCSGSRKREFIGREYLT